MLAEAIFAGPILEAPDRRFDYGEQRMAAYGKVDKTVFFVVYTWRGKKRRIISIRKAGEWEREFYEAQIDNANEG